ncbi:MAG: hypothetical protein ACI8TQ_001533 [Planctomycetota bacterium]|jgi:hypothetical protein
MQNQHENNMMIKTTSVSESSRVLGRNLPRHNRSGGVLVLALVAVVTVSGLTAAFLQLSTSVSRRQVQMRDRMRAFYVAEAALSESWTGIQLRKTGAVGSEAAPAKFGDGLFWVDATDVGNFIRLESTAMVASGTAQLAIVVAKGDSSVANLGVFSGGDLTLPPGTLLDGYDSRLGYKDGGAVKAATQEELDVLLGDFAEQVGEGEVETPRPGGSALLASQGRGGVVVEEPVVEVVAESEFAGRIGSGGNISVSGTELLPTQVLGDLKPGTEGSVVETGTVVISGATDASPVDVQLPAVEVPSLPELESVSHTGTDQLLVLPVKATIPSLQIGRGAEVVVEGPSTLVLGSLTLAEGASLYLDTSGGPVSIVITGATTIAPSAKLANSTEDPTDLSFQISSEPADPITLPAGVPIHGMIYAPSAQLNIPEGFELFGSLVAAGVTFGGPPKLHFDQYIDEYVNERAKPRLLSWRIMDLKNETGGLGNPFVRLGVDRDTLDLPADSHVSQLVKIEYLDLTDTPRTYDGTESAFDWTNVKSVDQLERDGEVVVTNGDTLATSAKLADVDALIEAIDSFAGTQQQLLDSLLTKSPLSKRALEYAIADGNAIPFIGVKTLLLANQPVYSQTLELLCNQRLAPTEHTLDVLLNHSPGLNRSVLRAASTALTPAQLATLQAAQ